MNHEPFPYSYLVGHIVLHLHDLPLTEHGGPAEAMSGRQNELVVDESPLTLGFFDGDENHPWHGWFHWRKICDPINVSHFLPFIFISNFSKGWLTLVPFLHGSAPQV